MPMTDSCPSTGYWPSSTFRACLLESPRFKHISMHRMMRRSRSEMDPSADNDAVVHIGPNGELYFVVTGEPPSTAVPAFRLGHT
jgi:hypothetical protein